MQSTALFLLPLVFLLGAAFLTALNASINRLHQEDPSYEVTSGQFFYRPFHLYFFPDNEYEGLLLALVTTQNIARYFFALFSLLFVLEYSFSGYEIALAVLVFILVSVVIGDYIPRMLAARFPEQVVTFTSFVASIFMFATFPITYLGLKLFKSQLKTLTFEKPLMQTKREIIEIIQKTQLGPELNLHEKKLIEYVLRFKDRIAREVMVPRVDLFSLSADTSIKEAAKLVEDEGYSRIPIYKNSVDNITGVLMYKDILSEYMKYEEKNNDPSIIEAPIETIQKNVLYTPETKKISNLLLEFKKQQVHLAIVVDEYGGTEGIVTIEDILEEIVGEIEDEYDEEEDLFFYQHDGSWVVDARMGILDVEQQLGIVIPQEGDYDTVGGYIFHCAGSIPSRGYVIHQEEFELEILRSDERRVEKVKIKPVATIDEEEDDPPSEKEKPDEDEGE